MCTPNDSEMQTRLTNTACTSVSACQQACCYPHHVLRVQRDICNGAGLFGQLTVDGAPNAKFYTLERNDWHAIPAGGWVLFCFASLCFHRIQSETHT